MTETGEASHVIRARREKLARLRELGIQPFAYKYEPTATAEQAANDFVTGGEEPLQVRIAGRVRSLRHGTARSTRASGSMGWNAPRFAPWEIEGKRDYPQGASGTLAPHLSADSAAGRARDGPN